MLGHGYADFTWSYVPLGAYSAFEPLGGILCTNLPIVWHMWRKYRKSQSLLPGSGLFKSRHSSSNATPSSYEPRRSRIARSLGLSNVEETGTDSQAQTILDTEEGQSVFEEVYPNKPNRALYFQRTERTCTQTQEMEDAVSMGTLSTTRTRSTSEVGPSNASKSPDLKKNVWEVRRS